MNDQYSQAIEYDEDLTEAIVRDTSLLCKGIIDDGVCCIDCDEYCHRHFLKDIKCVNWEEAENE